jgi:hypothetical protein
MNINTIIIIVLILIFLLCISSSVGGYLYSKNKNEEIKSYNDKIDEFYRDYNTNFDINKNKLISDNELEKMESVDSVVLSYPVLKEITVNGEEHKIYYAKINYNIKNYLSDNNYPQKINVETDFNVDKPPLSGVYLKKQLKSEVIGSYIPVEAYIITNQPLEKTSLFKIYYDPNGKIAPPYITTAYYETIPKKKYILESVTTKF